jgi:hypothetical protein
MPALAGFWWSSAPVRGGYRSGSALIIALGRPSILGWLPSPGWQAAQCAFLRIAGDRFLLRRSCCSLEFALQLLCWQVLLHCKETSFWDCPILSVHGFSGYGLHDEEPFSKEKPTGD